MSVCDRFFGCLNGDIDFKTVLKALSVEDSEANQFLSICYTNRGDCDNYEPAFECLQDATLRDIFELIVGEDECGRPVLNLLANICETCTEDEEEDEQNPR